MLKSRVIVNYMYCAVKLCASSLFPFITELLKIPISHTIWLHLSGNLAVQGTKKYKTISQYFYK